MNVFKRKEKLISTKMRQLITKINPKSPISEQYRTLRTNLQFSVVDTPLKTITITSAGPGAGKSITAANLAVVYAQQGMRTLLIDADLRKPTVHYTYRLSNMKGLSNLLIRESTLDEVINDTDVHNLDAITSGPIPPNPSELLGSRRMLHLIEELKTRYDFIIFDTPPALAVTDAKILSNIVDGILIVVRSGQTKKEEMETMVEQFKGANGKVLGTILNDRKKVSTNYYYYYGT